VVNLVQRGVENRFDGVSLLPLMTGNDTIIDREFIINICAFHDSYALIQNNRWKLIYFRDRKYYMLYDLQNDPHERRNLADEMPEKCRELIAVLERFLWQGRGAYANPYHYK
jgi:arylsulfatase A-like enzyme